MRICMKVSPLTFRVCAQYFLFLAGSIRKEEEEEEEALTAIFTFRKKDFPPLFCHRGRKRRERRRRRKKQSLLAQPPPLAVWLESHCGEKEGGRGKKLAKGEN